MKTIFFAVLVFLLFASGALAGTFGQSVAYEEPREVLSAVTATGAGSAVSLGKPMERFSCVVTWGGTTPTNTVVALEGSIDGSTWGAWATATVTATGTYFHAADKPALSYRANYVSKSGGDGTTAVTVKCLAMQ